MEYCKISGLAATSACSETAMGYYKTNAKPDLCDAIHDKDSGEDEGGDGSGAASSGTAPSGPSFTTNPNATGGGSPGDAADVD